MPKEQVSKGTRFTFYPSYRKHVTYHIAKASAGASSLLRFWAENKESPPTHKLFQVSLRTARGGSTMLPMAGCGPCWRPGRLPPTEPHPRHPLIPLLRAVSGFRPFCSSPLGAIENLGAMVRQLVGKRLGMYPDVKNSSFSNSLMVGRVAGSDLSIFWMRLAATGLMC